MGTGAKIQVGRSMDGGLLGLFLIATLVPLLCVRVLSRR